MSSGWLEWKFPFRGAGLPGKEVVNTPLSPGVDVRLGTPTVMVGDLLDYPAPGSLFDLLAPSLSFLVFPRVLSSVSFGQGSRKCLDGTSLIR